jgi:CheY-like chemotaxis protein
MLKADYEVSAAAGVDEALSLVHNHTFDGLVLDINLCEERTGVDLLRAIRALPEHRQVPAIACTAYTSFGDRERLLESGFDLYVAKPFTKEHLHDALLFLFEENENNPASRRTGSGFQA